MRDEIIIGIDPGATGAIAAIFPDEVAELNDIPVTKRIVGKKSRTFCYIPGIAQILTSYAQNPDYNVTAYIERQHAMPKQGVVSMFVLGELYGALQGIFSALGVRYKTVRPQEWKKEVLSFTRADKQQSILKAVDLFPDLAQHMSRKKDHGRAEALLIAEYGKRDRNGC